LTLIAIMTEKTIVIILELNVISKTFNEKEKN
jgi:hypothetical protein